MRFRISLSVAAALATFALAGSAVAKPKPLCRDCPFPMVLFCQADDARLRGESDSFASLLAGGDNPFPFGGDNPFPLGGSDNPFPLKCQFAKGYKAFPLRGLRCDRNTAGRFDAYPLRCTADLAR